MPPPLDKLLLEQNAVSGRTFQVLRERDLREDRIDVQASLAFVTAIAAGLLPGILS